MYIATQQPRAGFVGIGCLLMVIIFVVILAVLANSTTPNAPNAQRSADANQVSATAKAVKDSAQAGRALMGLQGQTDADPPASAAPTVDAPAVDPAPVGDDGFLDILEDIFDDLFDCF
jgi:type II secretory pathway pseudopilin PulG